MKGRMKGRHISGLALTLVLLLGVFSILKVEAVANYETSFTWDNEEEVQNLWPLDAGFTKSGEGIGTAGFSYCQFYKNDEGQIVLEFELSMFPDNNDTFASKSFREKWTHAKFFIDPKLIDRVDKDKSFFRMSYSAGETNHNLFTNVFLNHNDIVWEQNNVFRAPINGVVYPNMPPNTDYLKTKLYLILNGAALTEDYTVYLRYFNLNNNLVYKQTAAGGIDIIGTYQHFDIGSNSYVNYPTTEGICDVTFRAMAPFKTASMSNTIPNVYLPMDLYRAAGQTVIYDHVNAKLIVYYKVSSNQYFHSGVAANGTYLNSYLGIRQTMDKRLYDALLEDPKGPAGTVGQMRMMSESGGYWSNNPVTFIKKQAFEEKQITEDASTMTWRLFPDGAASKINVPFAKMSENISPTGKGAKDVFLHGYKKRANYVRFVYNVDKEKMDKLFGDTLNRSTMTFSTSYISTYSENMDAEPTVYTLTPDKNIIVSPGGAIEFYDAWLGSNCRAFFRAGEGNNYQRPIGDMRKNKDSISTEVLIGDPSNNGEGYTVAPYRNGSCILVSEAGLTMEKGKELSFTLFAGATSTPGQIKMKVGGEEFIFTKSTANPTKIYVLPNSEVRTGIIINRSANTPHVNEFFTEDTQFSGHTKYSEGRVSVRLANDSGMQITNASNESKSFIGEGTKVYSGFAFQLSTPAGVVIKKDMSFKFSNADDTYFRSLPATYRAQAKVKFDHNDGSGTVVDRIVPINKRAFEDDLYVANGFAGSNVLYVDANGNPVGENASTKYFVDHEGMPITNISSAAHKNRLFYGREGDSPTRSGYTFLGWTTKKTEHMSASDFEALTPVSSLNQWNDNSNNYRFTDSSPVDEMKTVYAVWSKNIQQYEIVLHNNTGEGSPVEHKITLPIAGSDTSGEIGELTAYLGRPGNELFDSGFQKSGHYFVGWTEEATIGVETLMHELYTNASKVRLINGKLQLQTNPERIESNPLPDGYVVDNSYGNKIFGKPIVNDNGVATIHLYAQYKPLLQMSATLDWFSLIGEQSQKGAYEAWVQDNNNPEPTPDNPPMPFSNSDIAMVLFRTTEGKTMDPNKYEIVQGLYQQFNSTENKWVWGPQEGHDANGKKYSYLLSVFSAQAPAHSEEDIINHFNNKRTWASMYITMLGQSDSLSKWTALSLKDGEGNTKRYLAAAVSNQPDAIVQKVSELNTYEFTIKNFEILVETANIHRVQRNHTEIVIDAPEDNKVKYLYLHLPGEDKPVLFSRANESSTWQQTLGPEYSAVNLTITEADNKLTIKTLDFNNAEGQKISAAFTTNNIYPSASDFSSKTIHPFDALQLEKIKQEPHRKDVDGLITDYVVSAKIPEGSYNAADYTIGHMEGGVFVALKDGADKDLKVKPDDTGKVVFVVPQNKWPANKQILIKAEDPALTHAPNTFTFSNLDITAPTIYAQNFTVKTGDLIADNDGKVMVTDNSAVAGVGFVYKKVNGTEENDVTSLPAGLSYDTILNKFVGRTDDPLHANEVGDYKIYITATDIYGNESTASIKLTINQRPTTVPVTSVKQEKRNVAGQIVLSVQGVQNASIKLYSKDNEGTYTEVLIDGVTGRQLGAGGLKIALSDADIRKFNNNQIYFTQTKLEEFESPKALDVGTITRRLKDNYLEVDNGAIAPDIEGPVALYVHQPTEGDTSLKIYLLNVDTSAVTGGAVDDIDEIVIWIENSSYTLSREYDNLDNPILSWKMGDTIFTVVNQDVEVINPGTGESSTLNNVGVLVFNLPTNLNNGKFAYNDNIQVRYYDYLGNASDLVYTNPIDLPKPVPPYNLNAINGIVENKTVITGMADPGASISVTIGGSTTTVVADENGEFRLEIARQNPDTQITITSKLNEYTTNAKVNVKNTMAEEYTPTAGAQTVKAGENPNAKLSISNVSDLPEHTIYYFKNPVDTSNEGDVNAIVVVYYADYTQDEVSVVITVIPASYDLPGAALRLEEIKQKPHIKNSSGEISEYVISAKIPEGSYSGGNYTIGYEENGVFTALVYSDNTPITLKPNNAGQLLFKVLCANWPSNKDMKILAEDPENNYVSATFAVPSLDIIPPVIDASDFTLQTGDMIADNDGRVTVTDSSAIAGIGFVYKKVTGGTESDVASLPEGLSYNTTYNKFVGKTADPLSADQLGDYRIYITAEDFYGNAAVKSILLTITQRPATAAITAIKQKTRAQSGKIALSVSGMQGASIKLYSKSNGGIYSEVSISNVTGQVLGDIDFEFVLPEVVVTSFNNNEIYITQTSPGKHESNKAAAVLAPTKNLKENYQQVNGGAIAVDIEGPKALYVIQPVQGEKSLKILKLAADTSAVSDEEANDVDKISIVINGTEYILEREYDGNGQPQASWKFGNTNLTPSAQDVTVVHPDTGVTININVMTLEFTLPMNGSFGSNDSIKVTLYDYLGNASESINTGSVISLPGPGKPYNLTAINGITENKTVIEGKAAPGAVVSITIDGNSYFDTADNEGNFGLEVPKQNAGMSLTVVATLNEKTDSADVVITNMMSEEYAPLAGEQTVKVGDNPDAKLSIANTSNLPINASYSFNEPVDTSSAGKVNATVIVLYADGSKDEVPVVITVIPASYDLPGAALRLEEIKQKPHIKNSSGEISEYVISAKIPEGSFPGGNYTIGYEENGVFTALVYSNNTPITLKPNNAGQLLFKVLCANWPIDKDIKILAEDPENNYVSATFAVPSLDITPPTVNASDFTLQTGDMIADDMGKVVVTDASDIESLNFTYKKVTGGTESAVASLPEGLSYNTTYNKFVGKTADPLSTDQLGDYRIYITAEDFYGNVTVKSILLTITQRPTTEAITRITQKTRAQSGKIVLSVSGKQAASIKLYGKGNDGIYSEVSISNVTGQVLGDIDFEFVLPEVVVTSFNNNEIYITQTSPGEHESNKTAAVVAPTKYLKENYQQVDGGAIAVDIEGPKALYVIQPVQGEKSLKILKLAADTSAVSDEEANDVDKISIVINDSEYILEREYDGNGQPQASWKFGNTTLTPIAQNVTVVNPNTGDNISMNVMTLEFTLPLSGSFGSNDSIKVTLYDYLGNASESINTGSVISLPGPGKPYNLTAINGITENKTVIEGKADSGSVVSITIDGNSYFDTADNEGNFRLEVPKQNAGMSLSVVATLNEKTASSDVVVKNTMAEEYTPVAGEQTVKVGENPDAKLSIANALNLPTSTSYTFKELVDTSSTGKVNATVIVSYIDSTKDEVSVVINVIPVTYDMPGSKLRLENIKQEPHVKNSNGDISEYVISAKIPEGSYSGGNYTIGYEEGGAFKPLLDSDNSPIMLNPNNVGQLLFKIPCANWSSNKSIKILAKDPDDIYNSDIFVVPSLDITPPTVNASDFTLQTGDMIADNDGRVTVTDSSAIAGIGFVYKKVTGGTESAVASLPEGLSYNTTYNKFVGKTADPLSADQLGDYRIYISAEDFYGNVTVKSILLTITQRPTTEAITRITQSTRAQSGKIVLSVSGKQGASIRLYSKGDDGTYSEISINNVTGQVFGYIDFVFVLPEVVVTSFNNNEIYITQTSPGKHESHKTAAVVAPTKYLKENYQQVDGGAIAVDIEGPKALYVMQPVQGENNLKILKLAADTSAVSNEEANDVDKISIVINGVENILEREYDEGGQPKASWKFGNTTLTPSAQDVTVVHPDTGATININVIILEFTLPLSGSFGSNDNVKVTLYDYLGNASESINTGSVISLPGPGKPYNLTAINGITENKTVIEGKANSGAVVSITVGGNSYFDTADNEGNFRLEVPKQNAGMSLTVVATLNEKIDSADVVITNMMSEEYAPLAGEQTVKVGENPDAKLSISNVLNLPINANYSFSEPVDTSSVGKVNATVVVLYADGSKDDVPVVITVIPVTYDMPGSKLRLENIRQEPHVKNPSGNISEYVISAKIPEGSYSGGNYTIGYEDNGVFTALVYSDNTPITLKPNNAGQLLFKVLCANWPIDKDIKILAEDPENNYVSTTFAVPSLDITPPTVNASDFILQTGDIIADDVGKVVVTDASDIKSLNFTYKKVDNGIETDITSLPSNLKYDMSKSKFVGKTADPLSADQVGDYRIYITAEDFYGNVTVKSILLTIIQRPTTEAITRITQKTRDQSDRIVLSVSGKQGASIRLYSKGNDDTYSEVSINNVTGQVLGDSDFEFVLPEVVMTRFNNNVVYITQTSPGKHESNKTAAVGVPTKNLKEKYQQADGGAIAVDIEGPKALYVMQPAENDSSIKILRLAADTSAVSNEEANDVDKIIIIIDGTKYILSREYDGNGQLQASWKSGNTTLTPVAQNVTVVNPNTGNEEDKNNVMTLEFTLPQGGRFGSNNSIKVTLYDYLGNASESINTDPINLPEPIKPYNLTAINGITENKTVIKGKADPGAVVSVVVGNSSSFDTADNDGNFRLEIPKQNAGTLLNIVATLNGKTANENVEVKNTMAESYNPLGKDQNVNVGTNPNPKLSIKNADELPADTDYSFKNPVDTNSAGNKNAIVVVTYSDNTTDEVAVQINVIAPYSGGGDGGGGPIVIPPVKPPVEDKKPPVVDDKQIVTDPDGPQPYDRNLDRPLYYENMSAEEMEYIDTMFARRQAGDMSSYLNIPYSELEKATIDYEFSYIVGFEDDTFRGETPLTRIQLVTIFARVLKKTEADRVPVPYTDMANREHWGKNYLERMHTTGMFGGYPDGEFKPSKPMTRAEFAKIVVAFWKSRGYEPDNTPSIFSDIAGHWAENDINCVYNAGLMNGYQDGTFRPNTYITRNEAVIFINKLLNRGRLFPHMKSFRDVNDSHWNYGVVEAATTDGVNKLWDSRKRISE